MLPKPAPFEDDIVLIMRTGIQFVDFALTLDPRKLGEGAFLRSASQGTLVRLDYDEANDSYIVPDTRAIVKNVAEPIPVRDSLRLFEDVWLPVPFLRLHANTRFIDGPTNWARARLIALAPGESSEGHTHRLVFAFDTNVDPEIPLHSRYLAPILADVSGGAKFGLAWRGQDTVGFSELAWVTGWVNELYAENAERRLRRGRQEINEACGMMIPHAHYLNMLWLMGASLGDPLRPEKVRPQVSILPNLPNDVQKKAIPVDLVLDVGNSRTVGILIEDHPQENDGLSVRYPLQLRDLTRPHHTWEEPFESRVEFAEAVFGKVDHSYKSGRGGFQWPTIARVGPEAGRLASRRRGTEGSTGLSSPKRYLWDDEPYLAGWRFNDAFNKADTEPLAVAAPFCDLINDAGEALYENPDDLAVFSPRYSRSSLMTFMLAEVLAQACMQMNSVGQRSRVRQAHCARHLRTVILTVPPSMPKPEREIFEKRVEQAIALVWKAMGWHPLDLVPDFKDKTEVWPPLPSVAIRWDEATCAQTVWLYSEIVNHFGGRPEEFIRAARRKRVGDQDKTRGLRVASIDIGGGTTDLVITDYRLDEGRGANVYIQPSQCFRDGFKVAGDDIVLDVITKVVLPVIENALREHGIGDPGPITSRMMGAEVADVQEGILRQQLTLQVLYPLALRILKDYEDYDPLERTEIKVMALSDMFPEGEQPSDDVLAYVTRCVRQVSGVPDFNLMALRLPLDTARLHGLFVSNHIDISKTIRSLCEIVYLYDCDWLLLSGRPSRLPGIQALFRALLALPPDRILPLHNYRTGEWYPFQSEHRIRDPKTTAAVGAMLCMLCAERRLPNFFFQSNAFQIPSTVRTIGLLDRNMTIKEQDVYFQGINLDDPEYEYPDTVIEMRGPMTLGFRQLAAPRWSASPLYRLEFTEKDGNNRALDALNKGAESSVLLVRLERRKHHGYDHLKIKEVSTREGGSVSANQLRIRLMTLNSIGLNENSYWLDTGSVVH